MSFGPNAIVDVGSNTSANGVGMPVAEDNSTRRSRGLRDVRPIFKKAAHRVVAENVDVSCRQGYTVFRVREASVIC
jgi:hypothetical protein